MNRLILAAALATFLSGCTHEGYDGAKPDDGRGEGNPGQQGKPGENKLTGTPAAPTPSL